MNNPFKKRHGRKTGAMLIALLIALSLLPMAPPFTSGAHKAFASQTAESFVALGYSVTDASGKAVSQIHKGDTVNVVISIRSNTATTQNVKPEDIEAVKLPDSFSGGKPNVVITSKGADALSYDVIFSQLVYSGVGQDIKIMSGIKGNSPSYGKESIAIRETVVASKAKNDAPPPTVAALPAMEAPSAGSATASEFESSPTVLTSASNPDAPVPNIIIDKYSYGGSAPAAGSAFTLGFDFRNTGKLNIENLLVSLDGGESFAMNGSTNTFFYDSLPSGSVKTLEVPLQTVATAKSGAQSIGATFKYEYVDGSKRASATSEIKLSVPVVLPDRFQVMAPAVPTNATAGNEVALTLPYVNKGKGDVSNVEATVEGDGVETLAKTQYVGNIAAGASGGIGFAFTPKKEGSTKVTLKVSYEDPNLQVHTTEFPLTLEVSKAPDPSDIALAEGEEWQEDTSPWLLIVPILLIGSGIAIAIAAYRRSKKAARTASEESSSYTWDDGFYDDPTTLESPSGKE